MLNQIRHRIESIWVKNGPDIRAAFSRTLPGFLTASTPEDLEGKIPVFCFHSVEPTRFEQQLRYLADNGYTTLNSENLVEALTGKVKDSLQAVALTFDDATGSFWAVAYPLLKKYGFCGILFVIPGLVPDEDQSYPNLEDVWQGQAPCREILHREHLQPLCSWSELLEMNQSGVVDIQGHSLTHSRINVSPSVVDFIHPKFDPYFFENIAIPINQPDSSVRPEREFRLGQPVYRSASRLSGKPRFLEDTQIAEALIQYVQQEGGVAFFSQFNWRGELYKKFQSLAKEKQIQANYETPEQTKNAIRLELIRSKQLLEQRLPGKSIEHLCYPWFEGSSFADEIAAECGYRSVFYGLETSEENSKAQALPLKIRRISEEYLYCLPGEGRSSTFDVWIRKTACFVRRSG